MEIRDEKLPDGVPYGGKEPEQTPILNKNIMVNSIGRQVCRPMELTMNSFWISSLYGSARR